VKDIGLTIFELSGLHQGNKLLDESVDYNKDIYSLGVLFSVMIKALHSPKSCGI